MTLENENFFPFHLSQPLSVGKSSQRILVKNPKSKEIEPSHTFSINEVSFTFLPPLLSHAVTVKVKNH